MQSALIFRMSGGSRQLVPTRNTKTGDRNVNARRRAEDDVIPQKRKNDAVAVGAKKPGRPKNAQKPDTSSSILSFFASSKIRTSM